MDICKHFECSNARPEDFVKFASFQLKDQAAEWYQQYKDSRGGREITWDDFRRDIKAHHIPQSVVESKREEFRNLSKAACPCINTILSFRNSLASLSKTFLMKRV